MKFSEVLQSILKHLLLCPFCPWKPHGIKERHEKHCLPGPISWEPRGSNVHHTCCTCRKWGYLESDVDLRECEQAQFLLAFWVLSNHSGLFFSVLPLNCRCHILPLGLVTLKSCGCSYSLLAMTPTVPHRDCFLQNSLYCFAFFFQKNSYLYCWGPFCSVPAS